MTWLQSHAYSVKNKEQRQETMHLNYSKGY